MSIQIIAYKNLVSFIFLAGPGLPDCPSAHHSIDEPVLEHKEEQKKLCGKHIIHPVENWVEGEEGGRR